MKKIFLMLIVFLFASITYSFAQSWQFVGARAMGMGGAGVATAYGPDAQYWNPAGLTQEEDVNETGLLIDAGANSACTPEMLFQFATMGSTFAKEVYNRKDPKIGVMNIGEEEEKGNQLVKDTHKLLKENTIGLNFIGNWLSIVMKIRARLTEHVF